MPKRLLDRQVELLEYLTSGTAIFGSEVGLDRVPEGFDRRLLRLNALLSHEKRLEKISAIFARTIEILEPAIGLLVREFALSCPPASIGRLDNARQFYNFLAARWDREPPEPGYLRDVAACELACAETEDDRAPCDEYPDKGVRRARGAILLRCAHDIRPIFEQGSGGSIPAARDTLLAIAMPPGADRPQIFEVLPPVYELLSALDDFVDPAAFGATPEVERLLGELAALGLIEMRG